jgi:hypothetical protein
MRRKFCRTELDDRRQRNKDTWDIKGQLYQTRSRHRRGHKLSLHLQDLAVEGASPATPNKGKKYRRGNSSKF